MLYPKFTGFHAKLLLENGKSFSGIGFGYPSQTAGEIVFNTGMVGYIESLTDPSYSGQILSLTYPLIGNYGVPDKNIIDEFGIPKYFESEKIQPKGLVIHSLSSVASHWSCVKTLDEWLYEEKIPGIYGIDTRELTKIIRQKGVMMGVLRVSDKPIDKIDFRKIINVEYYNTKNFMSSVSSNFVKIYGKTENKVLVLLDTGTKYSIIRHLLRIGFKVVQVPWDSTYEKILSYNPVGVIISNGPGDPKMCKPTIETAKKLIDISIPTLGICLGNQILALAGGADTYKLKYGHRGQNKSCINEENSLSYITSQNHGYGIDPLSINSTDFQRWFYNPDDQTIEGIIHKDKPIIAVQFHPEASPGPNDCNYIFDKFKEIVNLNMREKLPNK
ncbi:MAG: glutamine-hydrolyzing carbamoyl-phosphate synthase small subunit [Nitrososphaeraceae archaeon]